MKVTGFDVLVSLLLTLACILMFDLKVDVVGIGFLINTVVTFFFVALFSRSLSLALVYYIFTLLFLCIVPWLHYGNNVLIWRSSTPREMMFHAANLLIFIANIGLCVAGLFVSKKNKQKIQDSSDRRLGFLAYAAALCMSYTGLLVTLYLNDFSVQSLLLRGVLDELVGVAKIEESSILLLTGQIARFLPFFAFAYLATEVKGCRALKLILLLNLIITTFPTGIPRYMVAMVYMPLLMLYIKRLTRARNFSFLLIASVLFVFPLLDQFRSFHGLENVRILPQSEFFEAAHFDAYENLVSAIDYEFVTYGRQLLGVFLFFVPRAMWPDKPVGSGSQMAEIYNYEFTNISMPLIGEAYVNFGFFGAMVFLLFVFYLIRLIDWRCRIDGKFDGLIDYRRLQYFYQMGSLFFILRGDLMSSSAYFISGTFVYYAVRYVMDRARA